MDQKLIDKEKYDRETLDKLLSKSKPSQILVCATCGSPRIQYEAWIDGNTGEVIDAIMDRGYWCDTCEEHDRDISTLEQWRIEQQHQAQEEMNQCPS